MPLPLPGYVFEEIKRAYRAMVDKARYRPAAPSDGFGQVTAPLNFKKEVAEYSKDWWEQEEECTYFMGCPDSSMRVAMIYAVEAGKQMCSGVLGRKYAHRLLKMAVEELERPTS